MASINGTKNSANIQIDQSEKTFDNRSDIEGTNNKTVNKKQPPDFSDNHCVLLEVLCSCPQKCDTRISSQIRARLLDHFLRLGDHPAQNAYLQSYIEMRSVYRRLWAEEERVRGRLPRRVSCKYRVPAGDNAQLDIGSLELPKPKLTTNSKGKATFVMNPRQGVKTIEVCQKAFMNIYGITEKRVRLQREKLIARLRDKSPPPSVVQMEAVACPPILNKLKESDEEKNETLAVSIVDRFFQNQLWKPEYIGMQKDKLENFIS